MTGAKNEQAGRTYRATLNAISSFSAILGWTIALGSIVATEHWAKLAPRRPDFEIGAVIQHNEHGSITYFTRDQNSALSYGLFGGFALFFLAFVIMPKRDIVHRTGFLSWRMTFEPDDPEGIRYWAMAVGLAAGLLLIHTIDPKLFGWSYEQLSAAAGITH